MQVPWSQNDNDLTDNRIPCEGLHAKAADPLSFVVRFAVWIPSTGRNLSFRRILFMVTLQSSVSLFPSFAVRNRIWTCVDGCEIEPALPDEARIEGTRLT